MKITPLLIASIVFLSAHLVKADEYAIGNMQHTFIDPERDDRPILTEIYYPVDDETEEAIAAGEFPLLVFGHGFVMEWSAYENLWTHFVPRGYVMAFPRTESGFSPSHADFGMDIAFLVDAIQELASDSTSVLFDGLSDRSAVMGHSMGGGAAVLAAAQNPDITALLGLAPAETNPSAIEAAASITIPSLIFGGSSDDVTPEDTHQIPIYEALDAPDKTFISILGGGHCYFANFNFFCNVGESGTSGNITLTREEQQEITANFATPWLDYFLKDACDEWETLQDSLVNSDAIETMKETIIADPEITQEGDSLVSTPATSYQWLLNGDSIPGATSRNVFPEINGDYQVLVTYHNDCSYASEPYTILQETFTVSFLVFDHDGMEVSDAQITFDGMTYESGQYLIEDIPEGTYHYLVEKEDYQPEEGNVDISEDTSVEVFLAPIDLSSESPKSQGIMVFPNPAREWLTVDWQNYQGAITSLQLISSDGKQVFNKFTEGKTRVNIDISDYPAGIYVIVIQRLEAPPLSQPVHIISN